MKFKITGALVAIVTIIALVMPNMPIIADDGVTIDGNGVISFDVSGLEDGKYYDEDLKTDYTQTADNVKTKQTGYYEVKDGEVGIEYVSIVDSAPAVVDGKTINCSWTQKDRDYTGGDNTFTISVSGTRASVEYNRETLSWNPVLLIGEKEIAPVDENPRVLSVDPINSYYIDNTLEWDYGVCVRRIRVIEGMFTETWIFDRAPEGDVAIKENQDKSAGFSWLSAPFAYDANGSAIRMTEDKVIKLDDLKDVAYPITIDPTGKFETSSNDNWNQAGALIYNNVWTAASGTLQGGTTTSCGQANVIILGYYISRAYLYFNTSSLPTYLTINSANVSLRGSGDSSGTDFYVTLQYGMPTYPRNPPVNGDYDKSFYSGNGGQYYTSGWSTSGYNNISMNSSGIGWINTSGWTNLCLRSSRDISGTAPGLLSNEYVEWYSYENGASTRPYLEVKYTEYPDISHTPSSKSFGIIRTNSSYWSNGSAPTFPLDDAECYFRVTNNGNMINVSVNASNWTGGVGWNLSTGTPSTNEIKMKVGKSGDANEGAMLTLNTSPQVFITGLAEFASKKWELKLESGTSFTDGITKTCTIRLTATLY